MAAQSTQAEAPRVPAWKRLGLKLKYAKDNPAQAEAESNNASTTAVTKTIAPTQTPSAPPVNTQKRTLEPSHQDKPAKRSKIENPKPLSQQKPYPGSAPKTKTAGQQVWEEDERSTLPGPRGIFKAPGQAAKRIVFGEDEESPQPAQAHSSPPKEPRLTNPRKSVSFTPDTKQEDSFSAQSLFKAWASGEDPAESAAAKASTEQPASPTARPKSKKEKRKKTKEPTDTSRPAESGDVPSYLQYLEQYTNDKSDWKFNKNRQNDLFKHLFDIDRIPSRYNPGLVEYISTTQGQARRRIAQQAEEILKAIWVGENEDADQMSLGSAAERRLAYYEALQVSVDRYQKSGSGRTQYGDEQLREIMREHEQGKRAEQLLQKALADEIVGHEDSTPSSTAATSFSSSSATIPRATRVVEMQKTAPGQYTKTEIDLRNTKSASADAKRKRKRKSRTDISSSSSDSDSSSDGSSDSSSDESDAQKTKKKKRTATKKPLLPKKLPPLFDTAVLDKKFGKPATYTASKGQAGKRRKIHESSEEDSDSD
ncbi:hypothetical protein BST61_g7654 [Cercospora zeina]